VKRGSARKPRGSHFVVIGAGRVMASWKLGGIETGGMQLPPVVSNGVPECDGKVSQEHDADKGFGHK